MDKYTITDTKALEEFCALAAQEEYLSIDTEFMREHTYYPKLCLVQIGLQEKAAIIDPLAEGIDLSPLFALLQDKSVTKVFHAARQDLEIFYVLMGKMVEPVFDTQVASMATSRSEQLSYHSLVLEMLEVDLDKGSRMTKWDRRPLSAAQIQYAFYDVTYLHKIYPMLLKKLSGREGWIAAALERLCDPENLVTPPEKAWKTIKSKTLKPAQKGALAVIAEWREARAQTKNVPKRWLLSDESVLTLAQSLPKTLAEAEQLRLKPKKVSGLEQLIEKIAASKPMSEPVRKRKTPYSPPNEDLLNVFRLALHTCSHEHGFAQRLICTANELQSLSALHPDDAEWAEHPLQQGWRRDVFGLLAEKITRGTVCLRFSGGRLLFEEIKE